MILRRSDQATDLLIRESMALRDQLLEATNAIQDFAAKLQAQADDLKDDVKEVHKDE